LPWELIYEYLSGALFINIYAIYFIKQSDLNQIIFLVLGLIISSKSYFCAFMYSLLLKIIKIFCELKDSGD